MPAKRLAYTAVSTTPGGASEASPGQKATGSSAARPAKQARRVPVAAPHVFPSIGIVPVMIAIGYGSCMALLGGAATIVMLNMDRFFTVSDNNRVLYLSDGIKTHMAVSIMCFGTSYAFLWGIVMILSWVLGHVILFLLACVNLFCFNGVLAYIELSGPEHVAFVVALLVTHALMHHLTANSYLGFALYRHMVNFSFVLLSLFMFFWFLGELVVKRNEIKLLAFILELLLWICASVEFCFLVSMLHQHHIKQYSTLYNTIEDPAAGYNGLFNGELLTNFDRALSAAGAPAKGAGPQALQGIALSKQPNNTPGEPADKAPADPTADDPDSGQPAPATDANPDDDGGSGSAPAAHFPAPQQQPFLGTRITMRSTPQPPALPPMHGSMFDAPAAWPHERGAGAHAAAVLPIFPPPRNARNVFRANPFA